MTTKTAQDKFFVYAVMDGPTCLYVGKGCGRRHKASARKHGGEAVILKRFAKEADAFKAERSYISELMPQNNVSPGGQGGRATPVSRFDVPKRLAGVVSKSAWRRDILEFDAAAEEMARIGTRKYAALALFKKIDENNCEQWGLSKVDVFRLREAAYGCGA